MKRNFKRQRNAQAAVIKGRSPSFPADDGPAPERAAVFERLASDDATRVGPAESRIAAQSDIERADERKLGSIEAVPTTEPENGVAGFVEPTGAAPGDEGMLPLGHGP